jgi:hypothetical protein
MPRTVQRSTQPKRPRREAQPTPAPTPVATGTANSVERAPAFITPERRYALIAEAAYLRALQRHFEPGHEVEDWLAAEADINGLLTGTAISG